MDIISKKLANDRFYAYHGGRFWFWDEARNIWKESHLMAKKYDLNHEFDKLLSPEDFLSDPSQFEALEDYQVDYLMKNALKDAQPCQTVPIEPVEEPEASSAPAVQEAKPMTAAEDKPLTTIPDEMRPAFDYSGLDEQTVGDLHLAEAEYRHGKKLAERGLVHMGDAIAIAHDTLCGTVVAQCDNGKFAKKEDTFRAWCVSIGITKDTAYRLLQVSALLEDSSPRQQKILESLPTTLLYAVAKPSAPKELVEKVKDGEITTNKAYQDLLKENQQLRTERVEAMNRADRAENRAQTAESKLEAVTADVNGLNEQNEDLQQHYNAVNDALYDANLQRKKAESERDNAEARAKAAEDALKNQPIAGVVDKEEVARQAKKLFADMADEEVDRRAHEQAYTIAAGMNAELKSDRDKILQDNDALKSQLAEAQAIVPADLVADKETADGCTINISGIWSMALPSFQRLIGTGEDFNHAAGNLIQLYDRIHEELVKMTIANDKETLYE